MITRTDIAAHLENQVRTGFFLGVRTYSPLRAPFVAGRPSDGAYELYADMGAPPWPVQNAGKQGAGGTDARTGVVEINQQSAGGSITVLGGEEKGIMVWNVDWEIAVAVTHNAIDDDRTGDLESWARSAGVNFEKHKDFLAFDFLNNAGATTAYGAGYDGLSFFNDSHIDPGAEYQTAQDNSFALALSLDNFETVKVAAAKFLDGRGKPVGLNHNLLIVPPDLERTAAQISTNREAYDTANREINPYAGAVSTIVAPGGWLDTTAWFLIDSSQAQKPLLLQERKTAELRVWDDEKEGDGGHRYFKFHARYALAGGDWRLAIMGQT